MSNLAHLKKLIGESEEIRKGNLKHELGESKRKEVAEKMSKKLFKKHK